jgi:Ca2+-binding EF-hand superfamily protein
MLRVVGAAACLAAFMVALGSARADEDGKKKAKTKAGVEALFKKLDANNDGRLSKAELLKIGDKLREKLGDKKAAKIEERLTQAFDRFDADKKGLTLDQFHELAKEQGKALKALRKKKQKDAT